MAKLFFHYAAMSAGKTALLLQSAYNYRQRGMNPLLLKPKIDDRQQRDQIASRIGISQEATCFDPQENLFDLVQEHTQNEKLHAVFVDEAQFLTRDQVFQVSEIVDQLNIPVLTYGLRTDFRGELFEGSTHLLAWADTLREIRTICHTGKAATMTVRIDSAGKAITSGKQVEIGGDDRYVPVSRRTFKQAFFGGKNIPLDKI